MINLVKILTLSNMIRFSLVIIFELNLLLESNFFMKSLSSITCLCLILIEIMVDSNFKDELESLKEKIKILKNETKNFEDILSAKRIYWFKYDIRYKRIIEKDEKMKEELEKDKTNIEGDEIRLEKLLQEIWLNEEFEVRHEIQGKSAENFRSFKNLQLEGILEHLSNCAKSNTFTQIGRIIKQKEFSFDLIDVCHKKTSPFEHEFIIYHSDNICKNILSKIKIDVNGVKNKSIQLSKIAHEIKNIILVINNTCKIMEYERSESFDDGLAELHNDLEEQKFYSSRNQINTKRYSKKKSLHKNESLSYISCLSNYLLFLIEDLNIFTKIENSLSLLPLRPSEEIELIPALNFCLNIFKNKKKFDANKLNLQIHSEYECKKDIKVFSNDTRLKQIVINLLSNSYKFTLSGEIKLGVRYVDKKRIRISVTDTGYGMTEDEQKLLFNPFSHIETNHLLNIHGSGLGLSIIKEFLAQIGSKLEFTSTKNKGSIFWFDLDYCKHSKIYTSSSLYSNLSSDSGSKEKNKESGEIETVIWKDKLILNKNTKKMLKPFYTNLNNVSTSSKECSVKKIKELCLDSDDNINYIGKLSKENIIPTVSKPKRHNESSREDKGRKPISRFRNPVIMNENESVLKQTVDNIIIDSCHESEVNDNGLIIDYFNSSELRKSSDDMMHIKINSVKSKSSKDFTVKNQLYLAENSQDEFQTSFSKQTNRKVRKSNYLSCKFNKSYEDIILHNNSRTDTKKSINIVICDDENTILQSTANVINKVAKNNNFNVNILKCSNGIECIYTIYQEYMRRRFIDILFVDENMPFIKGSTLSKMIKTMWKDKQINEIKVFIVTSYDDEDIKKIINSNECDGIIGKPITAAEVENVCK